MADCACAETGHGAGILFRGDTVLCPLGPVRILMNAARTMAIVTEGLVAEADVDIVAGYTDSLLGGPGPLAVIVSVGPYAG